MMRQDAPLPAQRTHLLEELGLAEIDAALALHDLQHHGGGVVVHLLFELGEVVERRVLEAFDDGHEGLTVLLGEGGAQRPHGAAVEAAHGAHELLLAGGEAGELDGRLDGLGARVAQEGAVEVAGGDAGKALQEARLDVFCRRPRNKLNRRCRPAPSPACTTLGWQWPRAGDAGGPGDAVDVLTGRWSSQTFAPSPRNVQHLRRRLGRHRTRTVLQLRMKSSLITVPFPPGRRGPGCPLGRRSLMTLFRRPSSKSFSQRPGHLALHASLHLGLPLLQFTGADLRHHRASSSLSAKETRAPR